MLSKSEWEITNKTEQDLLTEGKGVIKEIVNKKDKNMKIEVLKVFEFE